jgi:hypothetical protein
MQKTEEAAFLFDDYFSDPSDRGIEISILHKGKALPFRIKRALTAKERQVASNAAITIALDKDGKPQIVGQPNQSEFTTETILVGLKYWPFEYSPGKPVPINRKTIESLDGGLADELASRILGSTGVAPGVLAPSEKK